LAGRSREDVRPTVGRSTRCWPRINSYDPRVANPLRGCVNDIGCVRESLNVLIGQVAACGAARCGRLVEHDDSAVEHLQGQLPLGGSPPLGIVR
jgi:hypothetical protein